MIIESILVNLKDIKTGKAIVEVSFEWFELEKKRIKKIAADKMELGIAPSASLSDGDILAETEDKLYVVKVLPTDLLKVSVCTIEEMGRACFELGNRHLSPKITAEYVEVVYDEPTFLYMQKLGFSVERVSEAFTDYIVCKAHGHSHDEDHHDHHHDHGDHHE